MHKIALCSATLCWHPSRNTKCRICGIWPLGLGHTDTKSSTLYLPDRTSGPLNAPCTHRVSQTGRLEHRFVEIILADISILATQCDVQKLVIVTRCGSNQGATAKEKIICYTRKRILVNTSADRCLAMDLKLQECKENLPAHFPGFRRTQKQKLSTLSDVQAILQQSI